MSEDCFFYHNEKLNKIRPICIECQRSPKTPKGWLWEGKDGYGPYLFECDFCQKVIYDGREEETE